jgi:hypothetical protein
MQKRVLLACECSGKVREALRHRGIEAISCDLEDTTLPGPHYKGYLEDIIDAEEWLAIIGFPPCTYIAGSGLHWNGRVPGRAAKTTQGLEFVCKLLNNPCRNLALENPVGCISTRITFDQSSGLYVVLDHPDPKRGYRPTQSIQPYNFGDDASKRTCLWLRGFPKLQNTGYFPPRIVNGKERWGNQTDSGQNKLTPGEHRARDRSETYDGIAAAIGKQWGDYLLNQTPNGQLFI